MNTRASLRNLAIAAIAGIALLPAISRASFFDNGGGDNLWSNNLNWSGDAPPSGEITVAGGLTAISTGDVTTGSTDLVIGSDTSSFGIGTGPAGAGTLEITGGTFNHANDVRIAISAPAGNDGTLTVKTAGTLNITGAGNFLVGNYGPSNLMGTLNVQTGGVVNLTTTGLQNVGQGASGTLNITGGTLNQDNQSLIITAAPALNGSFNMTAGTLNINQEMRVGNAFALTTGSQSGGTINKLATHVGNFVVAANEAPVTYNQTGGTLNVEDGAGAFILGWNSHTTGTSFGGQVYTLNGGDINIGQTSAAGLRIGLGSISAIMNVQSGNLTIGAGSGIGIRMGEDFAGVGNAIMNVSGGNVTVNGGGMFVGVQNTVNGNSSGVVNQTGGTVTVANGLTLWVGAPGTTAVGTYNLNGGTLVTSAFGIGSVNGSINWGDGTLRNNGNMNFNSSVNMTGAATWDTNGHNATQLAGVAMTGTGGLTKAGAGTLTLGGTNSYAGTTTVNLGTLIVSAGASIGTGNTTVGAGGAIGGGGTLGGSLHLDSGANFVFSLTDTLMVNGASVSFGGLSIANIAGLDNSVAFGTYTLIGGTASFNFANVSNFGVGNAYDLGGGKYAFFKSGSLQVEVSAVPEPTTWVLLAIGLAVVATLRRRRTA